MNRILLFSLPVLFLTTLVTAQTTVTGSIQHDGEERDYRLYLPEGYSQNASWPLVFNLHGFGSNALEQEIYSQMNVIADTAKFLVCYANGIDNAWNVGWTFGSTADDVGFISNLIDTLIAEYNIDPARVYSCGMSNGGFMSYRLACELNDRIAAIASVTGSIVPQYIDDCNPGKAVPVMEVHGTADLVVPYVGLTDVSLHIDTVVQYWVENNGCSDPPSESPIPDIDPDDGCTATRIDYTDCVGGSKVSLFKVFGGAHTWPGSPLTLGVTNQDFKASEEIWLFFKQYTIDGPVSVKSLEREAFSFSVYPNPAEEEIVISTDRPFVGQPYEIVDQLGKRVGAGLMNSGDALDVSQLPAGLYFLRLVSLQSNPSIRFIKK
jgi:polyhydroxybutyrate depolymerase